MAALLRDAMLPNLVQTTEGVPAMVHGGPFGNIAHGCNSVIATRVALHLADWAITEAGFAFDLGGEKFFDIKCRGAGLDPAAVVLVATIRALKYHGGTARARLGVCDPERVQAGLANLEKHVDNVRCFDRPAVVALNRFGTDTDEEIEVIRKRCAEIGVSFAVSDHFARGGEGALELAQAVVDAAEPAAKPVRLLYPLDAPLLEKIYQVATQMYGAREVVLTGQAERDVEELRRLGYDRLPICVAKTQSSLSDDPRRRGCPQDFVVTVRELRVNAGAGFVVVLTGDIMRMPGLPRKPLAESLDWVDGRIVGLL
jgi:formate--tetrahydrofolate ligase